MKKEYKGFVEFIAQEIVVGWAAGASGSPEPVDLEVYYESALIDRIVASDYRSDLQEAGVGLGKHGFKYFVSPGLNGKKLRFFVGNSDFELPPVNPAVGSNALEFGKNNVRGFVEGLNDGKISGWAFSEQNPSSRAKIRVFWNGILVGETLANNYRKDLEDTLKTDGFHQFEIDIDPAVADLEKITVIPSGQSEPLKIIPKFVPPAEPKILCGSLDSIVGGIASGWAFDPESPDLSCKVEFLVGGEVVGVANTGLFREDVKNAGFNAGYCGFRAELKFPNVEAESCFISARLAEKNIELNNSPREYGISLHLRKWLAKEYD